MSLERIDQFRQHAAESEFKSTTARTEESRRAWLIIAREWTKMAERELAKSKPDKLTRFPVLPENRLCA